MTVTEITLVLAVWLFITIATPSKVRLFISVVTASMLLVLCFASEIIDSNRDSWGRRTTYDVAKKVQPEAMKEVTFEEWNALPMAMKEAILSKGN